jgi:aspartokinase
MTEYSQPGDMMVVSAAGSTTNQLISWLKLSQTDRLSAHQVQQSLTPLSERADCRPAACGRGGRADQRLYSRP